MSAQQTHELQESCKRILRRLQENRSKSFPCILCGIYVVGGEEKLMQHLAERHHATVCHFSDVVDLDGFLEALRSRLDTVKALRCPVCMTEVGNRSAVSALTVHLDQENHGAWNSATIPALAPFCLPVSLMHATDSSSSGAVGAGVTGDPDEDDDSEDMQHLGRNDEDPDGAEEELLDSDDADWNDACVCLYCPEESEECLEHMATVHQFDMRTTTRQRPDIKDEYDIIRLINATRRCVAEGVCPYAYAPSSNTSAKADDAATVAVEPCAFTGSLEEHLLANPTHRLPKLIHRELDSELIPVLSGDTLISLVVTSGEGFLAEETTDPDFPMAPTLQQVAAHGVALSKQAERAMTKQKQAKTKPPSKK